jgi:hypothetical protein
VHDRVVALLRFIGSVSSLSLLTIRGYYYYNSHDKMMEGKMVTEQGYGMDIGGCNRLCSAAMGHGLVALFFLSVSIEDRPLMWILVRSQIFPSTYLLMGAGMLVTLLSWVPTLSGSTDGGGDRWRSKHYIESGPQVWGLRVQVWTGTWTPRRSGMGWSCLCLGYK